MNMEALLICEYMCVCVYIYIHAFDALINEKKAKFVIADECFIFKMY